MENTILYKYSYTNSSKKRGYKEESGKDEKGLKKIRQDTDSKVEERSKTSKVMIDEDLVISKCLSKSGNFGNMTLPNGEKMPLTKRTIEVIQVKKSKPDITSESDESGNEN